MAGGVWAGIVGWSSQKCCMVRRSAGQWNLPTVKLGKGGEWCWGDCNFEAEGGGTRCMGLASPQKLGSVAVGV